MAEQETGPGSAEQWDQAAAQHEVGRRR